MPWKAVYRHYNLLIDVFFWILVLKTLRPLVAGTNVGRDWMLYNWAPADFAVGALTVIAYIGMTILILFKSTRDEYAERIWQQAAALFVKLFALLPFIWMALFFLALDSSGAIDWYRAHPAEHFVPSPYHFENLTRAIGVYQIEGMNFAILRFGVNFPMIFAGIYKWKRWRDERAARP